MAIEYNFLFKKKLDSLDVYRKIFLENGILNFTGEVNNSYFIIDVIESHGFIFGVTQESDYLDIALGQYSFETECFIRLNKNSYDQAIKNLLSLVSAIISNVDSDFVLLLNGELIILNYENNTPYLNKLDDFWDLHDSSIFDNPINKVYPIV